MARSVVPLVAAYATVALLFFLLLSLPTQRQHRPHRRLKLRTAAIVLTPGDHHFIPFDPIISEIEIIRDDREWERNHFVSIGGAPSAEPQPEWEKFTDAEDYINDEDKFNVTDRIKILFPKIDVSPPDGFVTHEELTEWNFKQAENEVLHRARRDIELHDKDHDGCISFQEYEPPNWVTRTYDYNLTDEKVGWWKEEHFNASDTDSNGCLNLTEFNDFLHPADTNNPKLIEWLCREEIRERDKDDDGRLDYQEYLTSLFRLIRNFDEFSSSTHEAGSSSETQAKQLFTQLDLDHDGFLSANELKPIINHLHPSERFFAKQQADYVISQADTDKDGRLSLKEMIDNPYVFYSVIFSEENDYIYHDEFR